MSLAALAVNPVPFVNPQPVPSSVAPGGSAFTLTLHGTGLVPASIVKWNGSPRSTTYVNSSQIQATILASDIAAAGSAAVTVNSGGPDSNVVTLWIATPVSKIAFEPRYTGILGASAPSGLLTADFNQDGKADVALANGYAANGTYPHQLGVLLGNGDSTFQTVVTYPTVPQTYAVAAGDFNSDGKIDLVVSGSTRETNSTDLAFSILLGNGDGTFQPEVKIPTTVDQPGTLFVADFTRDGKLDIAAILQDTYQIAVFPGNGDGTFQSPILTTMSANYGWAAIGDFNGDGILDLAGVGAVSLGNADGTFQPPIFPVTNNQPVTAAVGDFNGDGKLDLASTGYIGASVCLGNGDGTFQPGILSHDDFSDYFGSVLPLDLNGDGILDLISTHAIGQKISYLLGKGDGTFRSEIILNAPNPTKIAAGDFTGDGRPDFVYIGGEAIYNDLGLYKLLQKAQ
jgi:hypothetical protein